jgi:adenine specific DNA methylase Mod
MRIEAASPDRSHTEALHLDDDLVIEGENLAALERLPVGFFDLIYMDPPFNTGRAQTRRTLSFLADPRGNHVGFKGRRYRSSTLQSLSFEDAFADYLAFLEPRLARSRQLLAPHGTLYFHIDYREAHYCKLLLDEVFGRDAFLNELIWTYDYGAKPRRRWPAKHDTISSTFAPPVPTTSMPRRWSGSRTWPRDW